MATGTSTTTQVGAAVDTYYNRTLLERALASIVHDKFGQVRPIPMGSGTTPRFRRYSSLTNNVQPLVEGVTPTAQQLAKTDVDGKMYQYGSFVELTDLVDYTTEDAIGTEIAELLGENAGESLDLIYRNVLVAGTSQFQANSVAARTDIVAGQSVADYRKIERALGNSNAKKWIEKPIVGTDKVGTTPIPASYYAIIGEYAYYDLKALAGFLEIHKYPDGGASAMENEVGSLGHIRFLVTTNAKVWAGGGGAEGSTGLASTSSSVDVHSALIFGKNAYGLTPLAGKGLLMINKEFGAGNDPLDQRQTSAWKANTGIKILNETFMYRYQFGVTA